VSTTTREWSESVTDPTSREAAALDAAQRAVDMLAFSVARYEVTTWRCRDAARAALAAGFPLERLSHYFELSFQRGRHDRVHSYEALPDEYVGNNMDLIADAYLAGGDMRKRLDSLAQVLDAVVKQKGATLAHRVQHAFALWGIGRTNDNRVRKLLAPVKNGGDTIRAELDLNYHRARFVLAVVEGDATEAARWLEEYDASLPVAPDAPYARVHLITVACWLIARDRYDLTLPTARLSGLPTTVQRPLLDDA
jgi:hypothetical protein